MATCSIYTNIEFNDAESSERFVLALEKAEELAKLRPPLPVHHQTEEEVDEVIQFLKRKYAA